MHRYLAFVWPQEDAGAAARIRGLSRHLQAGASKWTKALDSTGIAVLHANSRPGRTRAYILANGAGVILGRLFSTRLARGELPADQDLDAGAAAKIVGSGGRYLIENHWGRYVGFFRDEARARHYVLRDPSGGLPCFFTDWGNVRVFFSHMKDVVDLGLLNVSINWNYVTAFFRDNHLQIAETGLEGVWQLQAGECLSLGGQGPSRRFLWDPLPFAEQADLIDFDRACQQAESTTKICIGAWGSVYDRVLHQLSGGLDSSVVLNCLAQAPKRPHIVCENQFFPGAPEGDERDFARLAAARAGASLIEIELRPEASRIERLLSMPPTASPSLALLSFQHPSVSRIVEEHAVDVYTTGHGGDQIFFQFRKSIPAADYAWQRGPHSELLSVVVDAARRTRTSAWSVLRTALVYGTLRRPFDSYGVFLQEKTFLAESALRSLDRSYHMHPWIRNSGHLPPGKMLHVCAVVDLQSFQEPSLMSQVTDAQVLFACQPVVETCLRVPTYVLTRGGVDRAIERAAFARELPREIAQRYTKGATSRYFSGILRENLAFIRGLLLDGAMVRRGLLDRTKLEQSLGRDFPVESGATAPLLNCVVTEAWLQSWSHVRQQVAA